VKESIDVVEVVPEHGRRPGIAFGHKAWASMPPPSGGWRGGGAPSIVGKYQRSATNGLAGPYHRGQTRNYGRTNSTVGGLSLTPGGQARVVRRPWRAGLVPAGHWPATWGIDPGSPPLCCGLYGHKPSGRARAQQRPLPRVFASQTAQPLWPDRAPDRRRRRRGRAWKLALGRDRGSVGDRSSPGTGPPWRGYG